MAKPGPRPIELLSPAKNYDCGKAAIDHGADAVYIGAPRFGARVAAGNSLQDIERLARYAHHYRARLYITLNTLLSDAELPEAGRLAHRLYEAGADALIIQDWGLLQLNLPPIALHASTQMDNRSPEKVALLARLGFEQVVLARELSLPQIRAIAQACPEVVLEVFVHGALCVCRSGQCYMSEAVCGRSANRGNCAQFCRLPYDLTDSRGRLLQRQRHLLSLPDMDRSAFIPELLEAGARSFKIEGRLKDPAYVKNLTALYRQRIDAALRARPELWTRASVGTAEIRFTPDPAKTFSRGGSPFFLHGEKDRPDTRLSQLSPKSLGRRLGCVRASGPRERGLELETEVPLLPGDGLCYFGKDQSLQGFYIEKVEPRPGGLCVRPCPTPKPAPGTPVFRNYDKAFDKLLQGPTAERKIEVKLEIRPTETGYLLRTTAEDGVCVEVPLDCPYFPAQAPERNQAALVRDLGKWGTSPYRCTAIHFPDGTPGFIPASRLGPWRREAQAALDVARERAYALQRQEAAQAQAQVRSQGTQSEALAGLLDVLRGEGKLLPGHQVSFLGNVQNRAAQDLLRQGGVTAFEHLTFAQAGQARRLMTCAHCIKRALGHCGDPEPWFLNYNNTRYRLVFNCADCQMEVWEDGL